MRRILEGSFATTTLAALAAVLVSSRSASAEPKASVHILDASHFALDTAADQIAELIRAFLTGA